MLDTLEPGTAEGWGDLEFTTTTTYDPAVSAGCKDTDDGCDPSCPSSCVSAV